MYTYVIDALTLNNGALTSSFFQTFLCFTAMYLTFTIWIHKRQRTTHLVEQFPGLPKFPLFGSIFTQFTLNVAPNPAKFLLEELKNLAGTHGKVFKFWNLSTPKIFIADPTIAFSLYSEGHLENKSSEVYASAKLIGGEGLMALSAEVHPLRRKQWMLSFTRKQVEYSVRFFSEQAIWLCNQLKLHENPGHSFDFTKLCLEATFRASCYSAFGENYMTQLPESMGREHMYNLHTVSHLMSNRQFQPWNASDFLYFHFTPAGRKVMECVKRGQDLTKRALDHRRNQRKLIISRNTESRDAYKSFLDNMLDLLETGKITEKEVEQELNIFFVGSYDTVGCTIVYVLYFLSLYPEYQDKVVEELCGMIPPEHWNSMVEFTVTPALTKEMKYLELCIKEALRLYPILPISPRRTAQDVKLSDGRVIPANVDVFVMLYVILRDPEYFPEPDQFLPERHINPSYGGAFMPFALGARNCIGQVYAMFEMKVILAYLLMSYKWTTLEKPGIRTRFQVLQVPNKVRFRIERRVKM